MKKMLLFFSIAIFAMACGGNQANDTSKPATKPKSMVKEEPAADPAKGVGEIKHVDLNDPLNPEMVEKGKAIYEMKCAACHKLTDQRVVGPGWKGVTEKRTPEWIMNMIMNVDIMLEKDPAAQELLKECLVRMPNQNLTKEDARNVLEFMYANDGKPVGQK